MSVKNETKNGRSMKNKNKDKDKELDKILGEIRKKQEREKRRGGLLKFYLKKTGIEIKPIVVQKRIFLLTIGITLFISILLIIQLVRIKSTLTNALLLMLLLWTLGFLLIWLITWLVFFFYLDMVMYNRKVKVEAVLADFLQLTSANVRAGMTIDKALWFAIRPRFGILAKEIEQVAKETMTGKPLEVALMEFAEKYNSKLLRSSMSLLVEGLKAGGEIGNLLNRIASNIQETEILRKEMAANVMTYVIFISFATLLAAPFLMALSYQLLAVINKISAQLASQSINNVGSGVGGGLMIGFSKETIKPSDFKIFAIGMLSITSAFSSMIITTIRKGDVKAGLKNIPLFILITVVLFLIMTRVLSSFFSSLV